MGRDVAGKDWRGMNRTYVRRASFLGGRESDCFQDFERERLGTVIAEERDRWKSVWAGCSSGEKGIEFPQF